MNAHLTKFLYGVVAKTINQFVKAQPKHWVFGSDFGNMYREGSKYMMEYIIKNQPHIHCTFVTRNRLVYNELNAKNIPCVLNNSLKGIITIAQADAVFTCQYLNDILYVYRKENRKFYYMVHGQSYKKGYDLEAKRQETNITFRKRIMLFFRKFLLVGYDIHEVSFMPVTSDYEGELMSQCFSGRVPMQTLGMPRNDALFHTKEMEEEEWIENAKGKFVITYMPTHRLYGKGEVTPIPFVHNEKVQKWFNDHNVIFVMKQHPNMIPKIKEDVETETIVDISKLKIDPMVVVYHTNLLITDYSSVWMDYILLKRPLLFYYYDNFEEDDTQLFFSIKDIASDYCCYTESDLFEQIKNAVENPQLYRPKNQFIAKFHKYTDDKSCERYFNAVVKDMYGD